ncbi:MAG: hypothetical protein ACU84J_05870, partial [Gammaproteobacteria bacterium]
AKLQHLENNAYLEQQADTGNRQLDIFTSAECHPAVCLLEDTNPDDLSPRQALDLIYRLKTMI